MFDNEFANRAYDLYNGKTVKVRGMNGLHEFDSRFDFMATAQVYKAWYGPFGGTQYRIFCSGVDADGMGSDYCHTVSSEDDLAEVAKMISVYEDGPVC